MHLWLLAARPKTLVAVVCPIVIAAALAFPNLNLLPISLVFIFGLSIQILTNFVNDLFDFLKGADSPSRVGPTRVIQSGLLTIKQMKFAIVIVFLVALISGIMLIKITGFVLVPVISFSIIFAFLYTAGPYPIAYLGLGELFVLLFFGPIVTGSSFYILTQKITFEPILIGFGLGSISTAILITNNLRDYETDQLANKKTSIVRFGKKFGIAEYIIFLSIATTVPIIFSILNDQHRYVFLTSSFLFFAYPTILKVIENREIESTLADTAKLLIIYTLIFLVSYSF